MPRDGRTPGAARGADGPPRSWWSRNWRWFVPAGCLSAILLFAGFVAILLTVVGGAMKSSDAYRHALAEARRSRAVAEALGTPVREGWFTSGDVSVTGPSGSADLVIPVAGPKGKGKLYVVARKSAGLWSYETIVVEVARTGERIDLLAPAGVLPPGGGTPP
jgi:hypothetical protein